MARRRCCAWAGRAWDAVRAALCGGRRHLASARQSLITGEVEEGCAAGEACRRDPRLRLLQGLDQIRAGCHQVAEVGLPGPASGLLVELQRNLSALEGLVREVRHLPWARPLPEEQAEWEALCPQGGLLLRSQICAAAEGEQPTGEWFIGRIFMSEVGLLFESGPGSLGEFRTGLITWYRILSVRRRYQQAHGHEVVLELANLRLAAVQLQLGLPEVAAWLEDTWRRSTRHSGSTGDLHGELESCPGTPGSSSMWSFCSIEDEEHRATMLSLGSFTEVLPGLDTPTPSTAAPSSSASWSTPEAAASGDAAAGQPLTASQLADAQLPAAAVPEGMEPTFEGRLIYASLPDVRSVLLAEDWPLHTMLRDLLHAEDIMSTPWGEARRLPGTWVRRTDYLLPLPPDMPQPLARLIGADKAPTVTAVYRLRCSDDEVVCIQQSCSKGIRYLDGLRVDDILVFRPHTEGGVVFRKFVKAVWIKQLPLALRPFKRLIDKKVIAEARLGGDYLQRLLAFILHEAMR